MSEEIHPQKMQTTECITYLQLSPMLPGTKCIFDRKEQRGTLFGNVSKPALERDAEYENRLHGEKYGAKRNYDTRQGCE